MEDPFINFLHNELDYLQQTSNVDEFHQHYEVVRYHVSSLQPWLPEANFASQFTYGPRKDIQAYVLRFRPFTMIDAFDLACIHEFTPFY